MDTRLRPVRFAAPPCTAMYPCVPLCTTVYPCIPLCTPVYPCVPLCAPVCPCVPLCTHFSGIPKKIPKIVSRRFCRQLSFSGPMICAARSALSVSRHCPWSMSMSTGTQIHKTLLFLEISQDLYSYIIIMIYSHVVTRPEEISRFAPSSLKGCFPRKPFVRRFLAKLCLPDLSGARRPLNLAVLHGKIQPCASLICFILLPHAPDLVAPMAFMLGSTHILPLTWFSCRGRRPLYYHYSSRAPVFSSD